MYRFFRRSLLRNAVLHEIFHHPPLRQGVPKVKWVVRQSNFVSRDGVADDARWLGDAARGGSSAIHLRRRSRPPPQYGLELKRFPLLPSVSRNSSCQRRSGGGVLGGRLQWVKEVTLRGAGLTPGGHDL